MKKNTDLTNAVQLRDVISDDLPTFFAQQLDPIANEMAAFTSEDPADEHGFITHWTKIINDDTISKQTILFNGHVAGHLARFERFGLPEVSYWLGKQFWGMGIATEALTRFLPTVKTRPLYARAVRDNIASLRVLEKCGFTVESYNTDFANARGKEVEEVILRFGSEGINDA